MDGLQKYYTNAIMILKDVCGVDSRKKSFWNVFQNGCSTMYSRFSD